MVPSGWSKYCIESTSAKRKKKFSICVPKHRGERKDKVQTFTGRVPYLKPVEGGDGKWKKVGKEGRTANVCGDNVSHDLVTPGMFQSPDAEDSDIETPGEGHVTVYMTARNFDPAEEIVGELSWN